MFYITQPNGYGWNRVEAAFQTREELMEAILEMLTNASDFEGAAIALNSEGVMCPKRIGVGKSIKDTWITGRSKPLFAKTEEIRVAAEKLHAAYYGD